MTTYTDREATEQTHRRDAQRVGNHEVRFTDVKAWAASLEADVKLDAVQDGVVYFAIASGPATLDQVEGKPAPGGSRLSQAFSSRYVEANYVARGATHKASIYCGIVPRDEALHGERFKYFIQETAEAVQEAVNAINVALGRHPELDVRTGGAMHLHNPAEPWQAHPQESIETPPAVACGVCGAALHWSNEHWRGDDGRFEVTVPDGYRPGSRMPRTKLDHVHTPEGGAL